LTVLEKFEVLWNRKKLRWDLQNRLDKLQETLDGGCAPSVQSSRLAIHVGIGVGLQDKVSSTVDFISELNRRLAEIDPICDACRAVISRIPYPKSREILTLRFNDGLTLDAIAKHLEVCEKTVRNRIKIALSIAENPIYWQF